MREISFACWLSFFVRWFQKRQTIRKISFLSIILACIWLTNGLGHFCATQADLWTSWLFCKQLLVFLLFFCFWNWPYGFWHNKTHIWLSANFSKLFFFYFCCKTLIYGSRLDFSRISRATQIPKTLLTSHVRERFFPSLTIIIYKVIIFNHVLF